MWIMPISAKPIKLSCLMRTLRLGFLLAILLAVIGGKPFEALATDRSTDIVTRIERGASWLVAQAIEYGAGKYGFSSEVADSSEARLYCEENAKVAWALSNYHKGFTSTRLDMWLKSAVEFVLDGQSATGDFHCYYDLKRREWILSGSFHYWNAHIMAMLAQSAFLMRNHPKSEIESQFWDRVVQRINMCINSWVDVCMRPDGSWMFTYPDLERPRTEDAAMMVNALICVSGYEQKWGSRDRAEALSTLAEKTFEWILLQQDMDQSSWGYGGFYDDDSRNVQTTLSNARTIFGVLAYWTFIGLTKPEIDYEPIRRRMIAWVDGFALQMMDSYGGPGHGRTKDLVKSYPKRALTSAELTRDLAIIWVDLGGPYYWSLAERSYHWLIGKNEMNLDMQQVNNTGVTRGGFYAGIENSTCIDKRSTTGITAQCVEAMLEAMSIDIPEFSSIRRSTLAMLVTIAATLMCKKRICRRVLKSAHTTSYLKPS
jgi:hypothetical protein